MERGSEEGGVGGVWVCGYVGRMWGVCGRMGVCGACGCIGV